MLGTKDLERSATATLADTLNQLPQFGSPTTNSAGFQGGNTGGHGQGSSNSQNTDATTRLRTTGKESGWSKLREREREQVITMLKQKYPDRYEKLIEQYYKSFENAK